MHRVDEVGVEELAKGRDATTEAHVLSVGRLLGLTEGLVGRDVEKVEGEGAENSWDRGLSWRRAMAPVAGGSLLKQ